VSSKERGGCDWVLTLKCYLDRADTSLFFGLPDIGSGLGQADVGEHAASELAGHDGGIGGRLIEGRNAGEDGGAGLGGQRHVAQVNAIEGRLAHAEDEGAAFLERDVGGAGDERVGQAERDGRERAHGTWENNHSIGWMAAAGNGRADIGVGVLDYFRGFGGEQFLHKIITARNAEFLGEHTQRIL